MLQLTFNRGLTLTGFQRTDQGVLQTRPCFDWLAPMHYLQTRCVRADEGVRVCLVRYMLFSKYKIILSLIIAFMTFGGS